MFSLLSGEPKPYFKVGDSDNRRELSFCANCGSHLYATSVVEDVPEDNACWVFVPDYWISRPARAKIPGVVPVSGALGRRYLQLTRHCAAVLIYRCAAHSDDNIV